MTPNHPDIAKRLDVALAAVRLAAQETLRWFRSGDLSVSHKHDRSPVTQADHAAEAILRGRLLEAFPSDTFLGEESGRTAGTSAYEWIVDPIDGTKSFIRGVPLYAPLVGCRREGEGVLGVIAIPALDDLAYATAGGGAWHVVEGGPPRPARVSRRSSLEDSLVCSSDFTSFGARGDAVAGDAARRRLESACGVVRSWGDGYGYLLVATGRAELMVDPLLNAWDAAAVETVITEAGGRFTDWAGRPRIDSGDGVATNGLVHDAALRLLAVAS
ncbi:MAG: inositol monophosphatase family protein [Planctomycetia bacterium]